MKKSVKGVLEMFLEMTFKSESFLCVWKKDDKLLSTNKNIWKIKTQIFIKLYYFHNE